MNGINNLIVAVQQREAVGRFGFVNAVSLNEAALLKL